jgi:hypothetical protein
LEPDEAVISDIKSSSKKPRGLKVMVNEFDIEDRDWTIADVADLFDKTRMRINQICNELKLGSLEDPYNNGSFTRIMSRDDVIACLRHLNKVGRNYSKRA